MGGNRVVEIVSFREFYGKREANVILTFIITIKNFLLFEKIRNMIFFCEKKLLFAIFIFLKINFRETGSKLRNIC